MSLCKHALLWNWKKKHAAKIASFKMSVHIWRQWCSAHLRSTEIFDRFRQWEWPSLCVIHKEWSFFLQIMKENDTLYSSPSFCSKSKKWLASMLLPYEANTLGWGNDTLRSPHLGTFLSKVCRKCFPQGSPVMTSADPPHLSWCPE